MWFNRLSLGGRQTSPALNNEGCDETKAILPFAMSLQLLYFSSLAIVSHQQAMAVLTWSP